MDTGVRAVLRGPLQRASCAALGRCAASARRGAPEPAAHAFDRPAPRCAPCCASGRLDAVVCQQPWSVRGVRIGGARGRATPYVLWVHMAGDGGTGWSGSRGASPPDAGRSATASSPQHAWTRLAAARAATGGLLPGGRADRRPVASRGGRCGALRRRRTTDVVIVMAARAEAWKGHRVLIEACASACRTARLDVLARRAARSADEVAYLERDLRRTVARVRPRRPRPLRWAARDDVPAVLAAVGRLLPAEPRARAPSACRFVEAMYAGLPVVTSAAGGALEIVDETCGDLLARRRRGRASPTRLRRLIADAHARERMGAAGRRRAGDAVRSAPPDDGHRAHAGRWPRPAVAVEAGRRAG